MINTILECRNLSFMRNDRLILNDINLCMKLGDVLMIKGRNGSGKSTLLRIISGILKPCKGDVISKMEVAYMGHQNSCRDYYTVQENLQFWSKIKDNVELVMPVMELFGLFAFRNILYKNLSCGYKKKVALARILVLDASIWVLDEPFVNLDYINRRFLSDLIVTKAQHGGVILTSHEKEIDIPNLNIFEL